jgi:hypothetical protein
MRVCAFFLQAGLFHRTLTLDLQILFAYDDETPKKKTGTLLT